MLIEQSRLTLTALRELFLGRALALLVGNFYPSTQCDSVADVLMSRLASLGRYHQRIYKSNVPAFTETLGDGAAMAAYLEESASVMAAIRSTFLPNESPIDRLRCQLDELWPGGAYLYRHDGHALVFGMIRIWRDGAGAAPHFDIIGESAPAIVNEGTFVEQLGTNLYLRTPNANGDEGAVEVWDIGLHDLSRNRMAGTYGYPRELLPTPTLIVRPRAGDLLLLRSTRLHAVRRTGAAERVSLSGFIGYSGEKSPLRFWS